MSAGAKAAPGGIWLWLTRSIRLLTLLAACALLGMMSLTCLDVLLRLFGHPIKGCYDIVRVAGALTIACALPVTTALKGHVSIEYFFHKLNRRWRLIVDSLMRLLTIAGMLCAAWQSWNYGTRFLQSGQVTDTIAMPIFWVPWLMALSFCITAVVVLFHLLYPGKELMRP